MDNEKMNVTELNDKELKQINGGGCYSGFDAGTKSPTPGACGKIVTITASGWCMLYGQGYCKKKCFWTLGKL